MKDKSNKSNVKFGSTGAGISGPARKENESIDEYLKRIGRVS
jgi:hypothetical protein